MKTMKAAMEWFSVRTVVAACLLSIAAAPSGCVMEDAESDEDDLDEPIDLDPAELLIDQGQGHDVLVPGHDETGAPVSSSRTVRIPWILPRGQRLVPGERLTRALSSGSTAKLMMQTDGNLVLYSFFGPNVRVCWESGTQGGIFAEYQQDGNFVIYDGAYRPLWASNTAGNDGSSVSINAWGQVWVGFEALTTFCST